MRRTRWRPTKPSRQQILDALAGVELVTVTDPFPAGDMRPGADWVLSATVASHTRADQAVRAMEKWATGNGLKHLGRHSRSRFLQHGRVISEGLHQVFYCPDHDRILAAQPRLVQVALRVLYGL